MESEILNPQEIRKFGGQITLQSIGIDGQQKLKQARVLVIGAGGLGITVLQYLSATGIGTLGISDNSLIEETDLPRHTLFSPGDLGKQKAITVKEKLCKNNPFVKYNIHNICINSTNTDTICSNYDIVVDATKHLPTSKTLISTCCGQKKPMVYGNVCGFEGIVTVLNYMNGHSFEDVFPNETNIYLDHSKTINIIAPLAGIIGCYMGIEVIKIILEFNNVLCANVLKINILENLYELIKD